MIPAFEPLEVETYMDNAATTEIDPEVVRAMQPFLEERYGNPETSYRLGREAKKAVEAARNQIAETIGCLPEEIFFTSGGTESNNWAIKCSEPKYSCEGVIVSPVEHLSVMNAAKWKCKNHPYCEIPVDNYGVVDLGALEVALKDRGTPGYYLVSIQFANNEIGTIQPVKEIAEICHKYEVVFHCDAVQALGKVAVDVDENGFDLASFSAHKIHGPMGIGALYIRRGTCIEPLLHGGGHEQGLRSGTLAVHQIVGFGKAVELADDSMKREMSRLMTETENLAKELELKFKAVRNGHPTNRLPNIVNVTIPGVEASMLCGVMCSKYGVCASSGSACSTLKKKSNTLEAIGRSPMDIRSTIRFSMSRKTTNREIRMLPSYLQSAGMFSERGSLI